MNRLRRLALVPVLAGILAACGTAISCNNEFGAPPEREFWCAPTNELGKYFRVKKPRPVPAETIQCVETLGEADCFPINPANG